MATDRVITVRRDDGHFEIDGHPYSLRRSTHVLTIGQWKVWDEDPDLTLPYVRQATAGLGPGRPIATAPTYREARDLIDQAAARGGFQA